MGMTREEAEGEEKGQFVWNLYGIPMEYLWNNTPATGQQRAINRLGAGRGGRGGTAGTRRAHKSGDDTPALFQLCKIGW